jgi:hypothetical protein
VCVYSKEVGKTLEGGRRMMAKRFSFSKKKRVEYSVDRFHSFNKHIHSQDFG